MPYNYKKKKYLIRFQVIISDCHHNNVDSCIDNAKILEIYLNLPCNFAFDYEVYHIDDTKKCFEF